MLRTRVSIVYGTLVDEFTKDQSIMTLVNELHCICRDRETMTDIVIILDDLSRM